MSDLKERGSILTLKSVKIKRLLQQNMHTCVTKISEQNVRILMI